MPNGRVDQTNVGDTLRSHNDRLSKIENSDGSFPWVYVGDYPADPNTTPPSPPFQNGVANVSPTSGVRFKRVLNWLFIEGGDGIVGQVTGVVMFTLPAGYFNPNKRYPLSASLQDLTGMFTYGIETNGDVIYGTQFP